VIIHVSCIVVIYLSVFFPCVYVWYVVYDSNFIQSQINDVDY